MPMRGWTICRRQIKKFRWNRKNKERLLNVKIQSIQRFLTERERTEEEQKLAKETEDFYSQLYFLSLQDVNEEFYYKVKKLENDYTYLENLFSDQLPTNILFDTQSKVFWALGEIYGKDRIKEIISTQDQSMVTGDYTKEELKDMLIPSLYKSDAAGNISFPQQIEKEKYRKAIEDIRPGTYNKPQEYLGQLLSNQSETLLRDEFGNKYNQEIIRDLNRNINYQKLDEEVIVLKEALTNSIVMSNKTAIQISDVIYKVENGIATKFVKYINKGEEKEITYDEFVNMFEIGELKRKLVI